MDDKKICNDCNCAYYGPACPLCGKDDSGKIVKFSYEQNNRCRNVRKTNKTAFIFILIIGIVLGIAFKDNIIGFFSESSEAITNIDVPLPKNGTVYYFYQEKPVSYIEITNKLDDYLFIKLKNEQTGKTIADVFIHPKSIAKVEIPAGVYKTLYAGGSTWYGRDKHFGVNTYYYISDEVAKVSELGSPSVEIYMSETPSPFSDLQKVYKGNFNS